MFPSTPNFFASCYAAVTQAVFCKVNRPYVGKMCFILTKQTQIKAMSDYLSWDRWKRTPAFAPTQLLFPLVILCTTPSPVKAELG